MTEIVVKPGETPENAAHVAAMVAVADGTKTPAQLAEEAAVAAARPEGLPEGFNTLEELAEAYAKLKPAEEVAKTPEELAAEETAKKAAEEAAKATPDEAASVIERAGLNEADLSAKLAAGEGLSDAEYAALAKVGVARETVDAYIAGQQALGEALLNRITSHVGGTERLNALVDWATTSGQVSVAEAAAFNTAVDAGDESQMKVYLDAWSGRLGGFAPTLLGGNGNGGSGAGDVFASPAELTTAMRDPRYERDEAYRDAVAAKLFRSNIL
jgi:hypothetical protein